MSKELVYGTCGKCHRKIAVKKPKDQWLIKLLDGAIGECSECQPKSHWEVVKE